MRLLPVLLSCSLIAPLVKAQTVIYRTYADQVAGRGEEKGEVVDVAPVMGKLMLVLTSSNGKEKMPSKSMWGFSNKGVLFRIEPGSGLPVRLMSHHSLCYYENGLAHLTMQRDRTEAATFEFGDPSYLSNDLESPIVPARFPGKDAPTASRKWKEENPQLLPLITCIGEGLDLEHTRQCVVDHEVSVEEKHIR